MVHVVLFVRWWISYSGSPSFSAPPQVTVTSGGGAQIAGDDYTLTCQVTEGGSGAITYQWLRDGVQLPSETSRTLSFSPLNQRQHNGSYVCEGTRSSSTVASASVRIAVLSKLTYNTIIHTHMYQARILSLGQRGFFFTQGFI
jgi:hypothetical protein